MSRIGKKPITIVPGVEIRLEKDTIFVKGPKGELSQKIRPEMKVEIQEKEVSVIPVAKELTKTDKSFWGLTRTLIDNMVKGVTKGYEKKLIIEGLGYKAATEGETLVLNVGYSHQVKVKNPENIKFGVEKNIISIIGIDKNLVGQTAAKIRKIKPPEPYKGKGIRYIDETIKIKAGKKATSTS